MLDFYMHANTCPTEDAQKVSLVERTSRNQRMNSAIGRKRTFRFALHLSALGDKADMAFCENPLSRSLLGVNPTCLFALHMSAFDPKLTSAPLVPTAIYPPGHVRGPAAARARFRRELVADKLPQH